jgi:hypothetical protein
LTPVGHPAPGADPLRPSPGRVTAPKVVAALSEPDRRRRVLWLTHQALRIRDQALDQHATGHEITAVWDITAERSGHKLVGDITYIRTWPVDSVAA